MEEVTVAVHPLEVLLRTDDHASVVHLIWFPVLAFSDVVPVGIGKVGTWKRTPIGAL